LKAPKERVNAQKAPRSILVIQLRRIGDIVLTTPALAALKKRYPEAAIDVLAEAPGAEVLTGNPYLREVHVYDAKGLGGALDWILKIRRLGYDWVIDYMGNPRSALISFLSGAAVKAGPAHVAHRWAYNHPLIQSSTPHYGGLEKILVLKSLGVPSEGADFMPALHLLGRPSQPPGNRIGLVPASRRITRCYPASSYARLGKLLRQSYSCEILVFWGPGERTLAEEVVRDIGDGAEISPETKSLAEAAKLMLGCRLIVTNCNGPKHMAVALGVATLTIHASSDPISWNPPHPRHQIVRLEELFCIGCGLNCCPYQLECVNELKPERVFEAAARLLASYSSVPT
jgi:ADP-heptose:LPS heptosyltransferase